MSLSLEMRRIFRKVWGSAAGSKVAFSVVGAQKAGTSALDYYLRQHPELHMPDKKELHFFDAEKYFSGESPNYANYHCYFRSSVQQKMRGDVTPAYIYLPQCIPRMYAYNPQMKLIGVLRNPVDRAFSHWNMERDKGREPLGFSAALRAEEERIAAGGRFRRKFSYTDRGFYSAQIQRIWEFFPKEQTLFLQYDQLLSSPRLLLSQIAAFLEIPDFPPIEIKKVHARPYIMKISKAEACSLQKRYADERAKLERLLGWDLQAWGEKELESL